MCRFMVFSAVLCTSTAWNCRLWLIFAFAKLFWVCCVAGERLGGAETKINTGQTKGIHPDPRSHSRTYTHTYSHTHTPHHTQAEQAHSFVFELRYLQTRRGVFVFPGICKHPQQKQVPPEWEGKNSHRRGSWTLTALPLMSFRESW